MASKSSVELQRLQWLISREESQANTEIARIQANAKLQMQAMQNRTDFQTTLINTLGQAFSTGMQGYMQQKIEERKQEREQRNWAASFQLLLNKDKRDAALNDIEVTKAKTEADRAAIGLAKEKEDAASDAILSRYTIQFGSALSTAVSNKNSAPLQSLLAQMVFDTANAGVGVSSKWEEKLSEMQMQLREAHVPFQMPDFSSASKAFAATASGATGPVNQAYTATLTGLGALADALEDGSATLEQVNGFNGTLASNGLVPVMEHYIPGLSAAETAVASGDTVGMKAAAEILRGTLRQDSEDRVADVDRDWWYAATGPADDPRSAALQRVKAEHDQDVQTLKGVIGAAGGLSQGVVADSLRWRFYQEDNPDFRRQNATKVSPEILDRWRSADEAFRAKKTSLATDAVALAAAASDGGQATVYDSPFLLQGSKDTISRFGDKAVEAMQSLVSLSKQPYQQERLILDGSMEALQPYMTGRSTSADGTVRPFLSRQDVLTLRDAVKSGAASESAKTAFSRILYLEERRSASDYTEAEKDLLGEYKKTLKPLDDATARATRERMDQLSEAIKAERDPAVYDARIRRTTAAFSAETEPSEDYFRGLAERAKSGGPTEVSFLARMQDAKYVPKAVQDSQSPVARKIMSVYSAGGTRKGLGEEIAAAKGTPASRLEEVDRLRSKWVQEAKPSDPSLEAFVTDPNVGNVLNPTEIETVGRSLGLAFRTAVTGQAPVFRFLPGERTPKPVSATNLRDSVVTDMATTLRQIYDLMGPGNSRLGENALAAKLLKARYSQGLRAIDDPAYGFGEKAPAADEIINAAGIDSVAALESRLGELFGTTGKTREVGKVLFDRTQWVDTTPSPMALSPLLGLAPAATTGGGALPGTVIGTAQ